MNVLTTNFSLFRKIILLIFLKIGWTGKNKSSEVYGRMEAAKKNRVGHIALSDTRRRTIDFVRLILPWSAWKIVANGNSKKFYWDSSTDKFSISQFSWSGPIIDKLKKKTCSFIALAADNHKITIL